MTALHPALRHVAGLIGTWSGTGHGVYPTIETFDYAESVTFGHVGKPFLSYVQRTRSLGDAGKAGEPMHAESGYWRFPSPGRVEVVLSHPTGVVEIEEGTITVLLDGSIIIELASTAVALTSTAKSVTGLERTLRITGDELEYDVRMSAVGLSMRPHLSGRLVREDVE
jgi:hypothetical protein